MNRLKFETSPYLLQHAENPVHWYSWKSDAFERAVREDKPIIVSIGYSTCHWCHVMERESFEDPEIAAFMNAHFINIKVDREERPDVDHIYMEACQAISGSGGWPLNCFLLPDGRPFYAGTYYPPQPAYNRPSWIQLLQHLHNLFQTDRQKIEMQAQRLTDLIQRSEKSFLQSSLEIPTPQIGSNPVELYNLYHTLIQNADTKNGGFGGAPKFPDTLSLQFLLEYHFHTGEPEARAHVMRSLDAMIHGGIYDQIGGGFCRYTVDKHWKVPHFEKMLYDNALLVSLLCDAYRSTQKTSYKQTITHTLEFVLRELASPEGGFYAALDADSEGVEGKFYTWSWEELHQLLGADAAWYAAYCGVTPEGNWEHTNILYQPLSAAAFAEAQGMTPEVLESKVHEIRLILFKARQKRIRPGLDNKILLDWNALMCIAFARAYAALGDPIYRDAAERNLTFLLNRLKKPDGAGFFHAYTMTSDGGRAHIEAFLDDYANLLEALFEVYSITFNPFYLRHASTLLKHILDQFWDSEAQLFYFTPGSQQDLVMRKKELLDSATPSGNSTMLRMLLRAAVYYGKKEYADLAADMMRNVQSAVIKYPSSFARWASALLAIVYPTFEVAITGPEAGEWGMQLNQHFLPNKTLLVAEQATLEFPLLAGKGHKHSTYIYVCTNFSCLSPVDNPELALNMLTPDYPTYQKG